jgi:DNA-binding CsgD family transcriptional regulator
MAEMATVQILTGDLDEAGLHLRELISNGRALGYDQMLAAGMAHRSLLELVEGSFQTAAATARASLEHTAAGDARTLPHVAWAHLVQAWSAVHELDLIAAHQHLAAAEREASTEVDPLLAEMTGLLQAKLLGEEGLVEDARRLLAENRPKARISPPYVRRLVAITTAQTAALVNDVSTVKDQVLALEDLGYPADAQLFAAVALAGEGRLREALADIDGLLGQPRIDQVVAAGAAALRIGVLLRDGDRVRAADLLPDLLNRVAPQRMLQILSIGFVGGKAFGDLLEAESRRAGGHPFADVALTCLGRYATPAPGPGVRRRPLVRVLPAAHTQDPIDRLTPRERDVLVELSYGGSYGDVATALFVSENTVKTHLASVYRKLGVDRRVDALRIARDNDLL